MLRDFWTNPKYRRAESSLSAWYQAVTDAEWQKFADVRKTYASCDQVGGKTVFNVGGNHYRIITKIDYERKRVYIRAVLDHKEYDTGAWKHDTFGDDWISFSKMMDEMREKNEP